MSKIQTADNNKHKHTSAFSLHMIMNIYRNERRNHDLHTSTMFNKHVSK